MGGRSTFDQHFSSLYPHWQNYFDSKKEEKREDVKVLLQ